MEALVSSIAVVLGLVLVQILFGKKGAFPYGIVSGLNLYVVSMVVITADLVLMIVVDQIIGVTTGNVFVLRIIQRRLTRLHQRLKGSYWGERLQHLGKLGTLGITATPFAGGVWSGVALSHIIVLPRRVTFLLVGFGSIIGCGIFLITFEWITGTF